MIEKLKLGISTCLLGKEVRYDGGHKLDRFLTDTLGQFVDFVPVCPEVECGMPVPREAMRLVGDRAAPRLMTIKTGRDLTARMQSWGQGKLKDLEGKELCGYIFKSKSPSSGMARVKVYNSNGMPSHNGVGIWAAMFMKHFPLLPVEEEGRLHDPKLREMFVERIFVLKRWRELALAPKTLGGLVEFHTRHKMLILSHSQEIYREMGRLTATGKSTPIETLYERYLELLTRAMTLKTTIKKNLNVLMHLMGYFKKELSGDEKQEFLEVLDGYSAGYLPLIVPITLMNHYIRKYGQPYLAGQHYLNPHPVELQLRNHV